MSDSGWVKWRGGDCPLPIDTVVHVELRCGDFDARKASELYWGRDIPIADRIVAYKVLIPTPNTEGQHQ